MATKIKKTDSAAFAIIETGGKQYKVAPGTVLKIEKLEGLKDGKVSFDKVLLTEDGSSTKVGTPYVSGAKVSATVVGEGKGKKVIVVKYQPKSRYYKKRGHRQPFTEVKIDSI
jgi:large subunit ribosomal protein L21